MKKRMFSKFSSILQHAVDALAPQLSLQEEFIYHWKAVTAYFIDNKGEKVPVEQTNISAHLEQMLVILQEEEVTSERGMYGPCLEYLLQHKLLETMYTLARSDYPPGMKQIILSFFTRLLSRIKQPLLAHVSVYKAVQRLVSSCGEVQAAPTEIEEIQFLCTVCAKIKADPYLVNFFLEMPKPSPINANSPVVEEPVSGAGNKLFQEFKLVDTLLTLSHSADSRVAVKACEGLILCASLPEPVAAHCMINSTKFCKDLTQRLADTYNKLPDCVNPADLENVQAKWGLEVVTEREDQQTFKGKRHLVSFLSWLDYCDQLTGIANPIIAEALARTVHQRFLIPCVQQTILQASETGAISATAYLNRCLHTVCSERLLSEFVLFLLGEERQPETVDNKGNNVRRRLIDRCNHVSEEVCLVTLQLFDTLLQKDEEHILYNLVLRNLATRGYYDTNYHGNCKDLPTHIHEEFTNIVKQSENASNVIEASSVDIVESTSENSCDKHNDLKKPQDGAIQEGAINTDESQNVEKRLEGAIDTETSQEIEKPPAGEIDMEESQNLEKPLEGVKDIEKSQACEKLPTGATDTEKSQNSLSSDSTQLRLVSTVVETKLSCDESGKTKLSFNESGEAKLNCNESGKNKLSCVESEVKIVKDEDSTSVMDGEENKDKSVEYTCTKSSAAERYKEVISDSVDDDVEGVALSSESTDCKVSTSISKHSGTQYLRTDDASLCKYDIANNRTSSVASESHENETESENPTGPNKGTEVEGSDKACVVDTSASRDDTAVPNPGSCSKAEELTDNDLNKSSTTEPVIQSVEGQSVDGMGVHSVSPRKSKIEVHNIVNCFLTLVPEELKSSYQTSDSGYDMYLRDAHLQFSDVKKACKHWNYPETVGMTRDKTRTDQFYEGDFLHMLLEKLSHLLDQSYPVNLQLTSVISKLALVPHPTLHEFLLDPYLPLVPGVRSLYTVLQKVSNEIKSQLASKPSLSKQLVMVRRQLMSSSPNLTRNAIRVSNSLDPDHARHYVRPDLVPNCLQKISAEDTRSLRKNVFSWVEGQGQMEAIIILEEFCKELSAIAFIKHHDAVTGDKC